MAYSSYVYNVHSLPQLVSRRLCISWVKSGEAESAGLDGKEVKLLSPLHQSHAAPRPTKE